MFVSVDFNVKSVTGHKGPHFDHRGLQLLLRSVRNNTLHAVFLGQVRAEREVTARGFLALLLGLLNLGRQHKLLVHWLQAEV